MIPIKIQLSFILIILLSYNAYAQVSFEKGYFINKDNQRIDCLIKDFGWENNPTEFDYKLLENSETQKGKLELVKEFGVDNVFRYVKSSVEIDRSGANVNNASTTKKSLFEEETLFLKVLIEGKANLYLYQDQNLTRFFYNKEGTDIRQLIYKIYKTSRIAISRDRRYKNQLWGDVRCSTFEMNRIEKLEYEKDELIGYFTDFNQCSGEDSGNYDSKEVSRNYDSKEENDLFKLSLRPGLNSADLQILNNVSSTGVIEFDKELSFRFGAEAEFILPYNNNKWSIIVEPTYQYFKSEAQLTTEKVKVHYKSIELPVGMRHYFFLNDDSKIFVNALFLLDFNLNSLIEFESGPDLGLETGLNFGLGAGYKHNDRISLEVRYHTHRKLLRNFAFWVSGYQKMSVILGYTIFRKSSG